MDPQQNSPSDSDAPKGPTTPEAVPGERLGVPSGIARSIPDPGAPAPSFVFLAVIAVITIVADLGTKVWAEKRLEEFPGYIDLVPNYLTLLLAKNKGGAWGLLQGTSEYVRRPFFLLVSAAAIAFIVALYRKLQPGQTALKWGLPLVLGGALGNVVDRIRYGHVIDFIDFHLTWGGRDHHWPTFNVADIAICIGVGLMAVDMFTAKKAKPASAAVSTPAAPTDDASPRGPGEAE